MVGGGGSFCVWEPLVWLVFWVVPCANDAAASIVPPSRRTMLLHIRKDLDKTDCLPKCRQKRSRQRPLRSKMERLGDNHSRRFLLLTHQNTCLHCRLAN